MEEVTKLTVVDPSIVPVQSKLVFERDILEIPKEIHQPDHRALDDVVFDVLGLTLGEGEAVYEAVVELVKRRLEKAKSV